jgi:hypothetical protein
MAARLMGYVSASNTPTVVQQSAYGRATGGIGAPTAVTISSVDYEYLTFNAIGTLTVTTAGWFDYLRSVAVAVQIVMAAVAVAVAVVAV